MRRRIGKLSPNNAAELAIVEELAVQVALSIANSHDLIVTCYAMRNEYIDRLTFSFGQFVRRPVINKMLQQLLDLGQWLPESVRWKAFDGDLSVRSMDLVRLHKL